ncbi:MAG: tetratricopeptide repeat protein [Candidatus Brocadiales bacterium]|nr:tetratricopeptide repeat protein [Candidatus Bathyanammoxibius sp.]
MQLLLTIFFVTYLALGSGAFTVYAQTNIRPLKSAATDAGRQKAAGKNHHDADVTGSFLRGEDHITRWEISEADETAKKILSLQPDSPEGLYLAAKVAFYRGRYKDAMEMLEGPPQGFLEGRRLSAFIADVYDTAQNFEEYPTEHFIIRYVPGRDQVLLEDAARTLERACTEIGRDLQYLPEEKIVVEVYPSVDGFSTASTLTKKEIETSGTVAICHFNRLMIMSPRLLLRGYPWADTLAHEYVHYVITKRTRNFTPIWFHEGLAKYEESRWKSDGGRELTPLQSHLLARAVEDDYFITFEQMHPSLAKLKSAEDAALAFAEVLTAMTYIIEKGGGYPALNDILDVIAMGKSVEEAVEEGLGMPFEEFEREWKVYLRKTSPQKIPGLKVMPTRLKDPAKPGQTEESPVEIEVAEARKFTMLGDLLQEQSRPDAALYEYEKARRYAGLGSPQILNKLARTYIQNHRDDDAQRVLSEALSYYPHYVAIYITQGELFAKRGETARAIENFRSATYINPFNPAVHQRLAQLYNKSGDKDAARKSLQKLAILLKDPHYQTEAEAPE